MDKRDFIHSTMNAITIIYGCARRTNKKIDNLSKDEMKEALDLILQESEKIIEQIEIFKKNYDNSIS